MGGDKNAKGEEKMVTRKCDGGEKEEGLSAV